MRFEILALRPFEQAPKVGHCAELTVGYADLTIVGCHLGHDEMGRAYVAFPKIVGYRARIHCKDSGTRRRMVTDAVALYEAMTTAAETPVAKASRKLDTFDAKYA